VRVFLIVVFCCQQQYLLDFFYFSPFLFSLNILTCDIIFFLSRTDKRDKRDYNPIVVSQGGLMFYSLLTYMAFYPIYLRFLTVEDRVERTRRTNVYSLVYIIQSSSIEMGELGGL
jgi:hypothetical protein